MRFTMVLLLLPLTAWAQSPLTVVPEIEHNLNPGDFVAQYELTNFRTDGTVNSYEVRFQVKDVDHAHGTFIKPEREKGREVLRVDDALWTYLPSVGRSLRIADRDSFAGGDFSNADMLRTDWSASYNVALVKETANQWVFDMTAKVNDAAYAKMRLWVDRKSRQPMQQYYYDSSGTLLKRCQYGAIQAFGPITRPAFLHMENVLTGQKTDLKVLSLRTAQKIAESRFAVDNLGK